METTILAKDSASARLLLNISPRSSDERCRVVAIRTGICDAPGTDCAAGTRTPCSGRVAQEQQASASATASADRKPSLLSIPLTAPPCWNAEPRQIDCPSSAKILFKAPYRFDPDQALE